MAKNLQAGLRQSIKASRKAGLAGSGVFSRAPLDLRFALQKTLDPRITFTRASSATFVDSSGVIRSAVTNLVLNSEDFSNATWTTSNITVTTNAAVAPNGATTADAVLETAANADHTIYATSTQTFTTGTQSIYVKPNGRTNAALRFYNTGNDWHTIVFNLTGNGSVTQSSAGSSSGFSAVSSSIVNVGGGWYRISMTATQSSRTTFVWALDLCTTSTPTLDTASGVELYAGDTGKGVFLWGAQFQTASTVGEYIPTTSAINSAPRFDHNPTTGESLGLLPEEARTNLALRSEEFEDSAWNSAAGARTVTPNQITAPNGTTTADLVTADGTNAVHLVSQAFTLSAIPYTFSVFAKRDTQSVLVIRPFAAFGAFSAVFNINTGTVFSNTLGTTAEIIAYPNDWYRCVFGFTPTAASSSIGIYISSTAVNTTTTGFYLWGAQLEAGAISTSYIPTTSATVTRAADVASITGSNFSSWYQGNTGTLFFEGINPAASTTAFAVSDGSINNRLQMDAGTNTRVTRVVSGGTTQANNSIAYTYGTSQRFALSYAADSINFANAGTLGTEDTSATIPTVDQARIGANPTGGNPLNGTIKRLTYWPTRLANATLQQITQP